MKQCSFWSLVCGIVFVTPFGGGVAVAQRASENAITAADDAFGTRVGNESIGLYGAYNVRGFSPVSAGNVRIDGLYFDQQTQPHTRISRGATVRVGISAQAYSLPAPSGIADYSLRIPGDKQVVSTVLTYGPWATHNIEIDAQFPLITDKFSLGLGVGALRIDNDAGFKSKNNEWSGGAIARLRPSDTSEVIGVFGMFDDCNNGQQPGLFTAGPYAPPRFKRHTYFGQDWSRGACRDSNSGVLGRVNLPGDWTLRAGGFRSESRRFFYGDFLRNMPGIDLELTQGEVRNVRLRGLGSEYNAVTIDGVSLASSDAHRGAAGEDAFLPLQPLELPDAQRNQDRQRDQHRHGQAPGKAAQGHSLSLFLASLARKWNWAVTSRLLKTGARTRPSPTVSGRLTASSTQTGGERESCR